MTGSIPERPSKRWEEERDSRDAPVWYSAEEAAAWAAGYNYAVGRQVNRAFAKEEVFPTCGVCLTRNGEHSRTCSLAEAWPFVPPMNWNSAQRRAERDGRGR